MRYFPTERVVRLPEIIEVTGLSRSAIYSRINNKTFPPPFSLGGKAVGWFAYEIESVTFAWSNGMPPKKVRKLIEELLSKRKAKL
ncbi:AlpA family phage regulatory protein [Agarivorans litoreus]|uniref:AlpA family phage regulatory protein n=1 Tax=Agarivorans litoreus TaxID=1510455 RepID=UPI001C7D37E7|nr:AlpA family phage regulatory protein [Agarivorans litoreus]